MTRDKQIIAVDFDGVIHSYTSGWRGASCIPDSPVAGAISALLRLLDTGFTVAIFSARSSSLRGRWAMKRWLAREIARHWEKGGALPSDVEAECWGDAARVYRRFQWPWFKPAAMVTIDDRALTFNGKWAEFTPENLHTFKTWQKGGGHGALHVSAPKGYKCSDCTMDGEPCPDCYIAWWKKRHPDVRTHTGTRV